MATEANGKGKLPARLGSAELCEERRADIANLTDHLLDLVNNQEDGEEDSWGEAGSLGHVRELLAQAVSFYSGLDLENIEAVLEEIRG